MAAGRLARAQLTSSTSAARSGTGSTAAAAVPSLAQVVAGSGSGASAASGAPRLTATATTAGAGAANGAGRPAFILAATQSGSGQIDAASTQVVYATAAATGDSLLDAYVAALQITASPVDITAEGTLAADALLALSVDAVFAGEGLLDAIGSPAFVAPADGTGVGELEATAKVLVMRNINITVGAPTGHPFAVMQPQGNPFTVGSPEAT